MLNFVNSLSDRLLYCGLVGQILVGIGWGTPGAYWLSLDVQNAVSQLGYLGLIVIVYEGEQQMAKLTGVRERTTTAPGTLLSPRSSGCMHPLY